MHDFDDEEFEKIIGEEIEEFYCFCKSETCSIEKMIPCEGPDCKTKFFHHSSAISVYWKKSNAILHLIQL